MAWVQYTFVLIHEFLLELGRIYTWSKFSNGTERCFLNFFLSSRHGEHRGYSEGQNELKSLLGSTPVPWPHITNHPLLSGTKYYPLELPQLEGCPFDPDRVILITVMVVIYVPELGFR